MLAALNRQTNQNIAQEDPPPLQAQPVAAPQQPRPRGRPRQRQTQNLPTRRSARQAAADARSRINEGLNSNRRQGRLRPERSRSPRRNSPPPPPSLSPPPPSPPSPEARSRSPRHSPPRRPTPPPATPGPSGLQRPRSPSPAASNISADSNGDHGQAPFSFQNEVIFQDGGVQASIRQRHLKRQVYIKKVPFS